jgi:peptidoglycan/LPS O-acetylase OafA/YrhL
VNKSTSLYLDIVRTVAALTVAVHHFSNPQFSGEHLSWFKYGNDAVLVFFVLSGLVIGYVSEEKERNTTIFLFKRISRLWSVLIPAVILSCIVELVKYGFTKEHLLNNFMISKDTLLFTNENWASREGFLVNFVFWSLTFEFWYYIFFTCLYLLKKKIGYLLFLIAVAFTGYKIILLFPIWLMGFYVYKSGKKKVVHNKKAAIALSIITLLVLLVFVVVGQTLKQKLAIEYLFVPALPLGDVHFIAYQYMIGLLVSIHLFSVLQMFNFHVETIPFLPERAIKYVASISFAIYCFHSVVFNIVKLVYPFNSGPALQLLYGALISFPLLFLVSSIVERWEGFIFNKKKIFSLWLNTYQKSKNKINNNGS